MVATTSPPPDDAEPEPKSQKKNREKFASLDPIELERIYHSIERKVKKLYRGKRLSHHAIKDLSDHLSGLCEISGSFNYLVALLHIEGTFFNDLPEARKHLALAEEYKHWAAPRFHRLLEAYNVDGVRNVARIIVLNFYIHDDPVEIYRLLETEKQELYLEKFDKTKADFSGQDYGNAANEHTGQSNLVAERQVPMEGDDKAKTGRSAGRMPRYEGGVTHRKVAIPKALAEEFERNAAAEGTSFGCYVFEHYIAPNVDNLPKIKEPQN